MVGHFPRMVYDWQNIQNNKDKHRTSHKMYSFNNPLLKWGRVEIPHTTHIFLKLPAKGERKPTQSRAAFLFGIEGRAEGERCIETRAGAET